MITVYYGNFVNQFIDEPEPLFKSFTHEHINEKNIGTKNDIFSLVKCPAFIDYCKNTFVLKNLIDYDIKYTEEGCFSNFLDQNHFMRWVFPRGKDGFISYTHPQHLFYSESSLEMEITAPFLHNCDVSKKAVVIPGKYNIGKHLRAIECGMRYHNYDTIKFEQSEPYMYIRFLTKEKIQFKPFYMNDELKNLINTVLNLKNSQKIKPLLFWYNINEKFYRKKTLNLIKQNLI